MKQVHWKTTVTMAIAVGVQLFQALRPDIIDKKTADAITGLSLLLFGGAAADKPNNSTPATPGGSAIAPLAGIVLFLITGALLLFSCSGCGAVKTAFNQNVSATEKPCPQSDSVQIIFKQQTYKVYYCVNDSLETAEIKYYLAKHFH